MIKTIKRRRLAGALAALCLLAGCAAVGSATAASTGTTDAARYKVALVAKSTQTDFWKAVFVGAEAAATEYNLDLTIDGPDTEEDYETQNQMIARAVEDGAQALVFSAIDFDANAPAIEAAADKGVKIVVIDSAVNTEDVVTYIGTDNYSAGQMAAQAALDGVEGTLKVGIVNYDVNSANGQDRERGAVDTFAGSGRAQIVTTIHTLAEATSAKKDTLEMLRAHPEINVVLAFNEPTSVGAAQAVEELHLQNALWMVAFDSNLVTIDALQSGVVDALVIQNTYEMGYFGVQSAYKLLTGQRSDLEKHVDTATRIINRENMFALDGQKVLFPFS